MVLELVGSGFIYRFVLLLICSVGFLVSAVLRIGLLLACNIISNFDFELIRLSLLKFAYVGRSIDSVTFGDNKPRPKLNNS